MDYLNIDKLTIIFAGESKDSDQLSELKQGISEALRKVFGRIVEFESVNETQLLQIELNNVKLDNDIPGGFTELDSCINGKIFEVTGRAVSVNEIWDAQQLLIAPEKAFKQRKIIITPMW